MDIYLVEHSWEIHGYSITKLDSPVELFFVIYKIIALSWLEAVSHSQPLTPAGEGLVTCNAQSCSAGMQKLAILRDVTLQFILRSARLPIISISARCLMTTCDICAHA